jgi:integrase
MTLASLIDEYMAQYSDKDMGILASMAFWRHHLGAKKLIDVTAREIRDLLNGYAEGRFNVPIDPSKKATRKPGARSPATVNRRKAALSALFSYAKREGYITRTSCCQSHGKQCNRPLAIRR